MKLCRDPVAEVRNGSGLQLHAILKRIDELKVSWRPEFVEELQDLARDRLFQHRLIFAQMCITVLQTIKESEENKAPEAANDIEMFKRDLLPHLLALAEDRVANIRQRAGISLQLIKEIKGFKNDAKVAAALAALTKDKDVEVLRSMGQKLQVGLTSCKHLGA